LAASFLISEGYSFFVYTEEEKRKEEEQLQFTPHSSGVTFSAKSAHLSE